MADILGSTGTTASLTVGGSAISTIDSLGDHDWFAINLTAGVQVTLTVYGITLEDPLLYLRSGSGTVVATNDDIVDGENRNSLLTFTPSSSGLYYLDVGAFGDQYAGSYQVSVQPGTQTPIAAVDTLAGYLVQGAWAGQAHHFDISSGTISVNISTLNASEQNLARTALQEWGDVIGVNFQEVASGAQITFNNTEVTAGTPVAQTDANWSSTGITSSATVQISTSWVNRYGTGLNTYSFQTYLHEIGHALGLGHGGDYNGTATYSTDALFRNDAWSTTVMSYFDQNENSYFAGMGFNRVYALTPMEADIAGMQTLYGLSTTTRLGDTVYGFNATAGGVYNASNYANVAVTIVDSGGNDTIDYSASAANQLINLNPENFSNVNGRVGNLEIGRGTVIENAIGGSGNDMLIGNGAGNILTGGAGNDTLVGFGGADIFRGGAGVDTVQYVTATNLDFVNSANTTGDAVGDSFDSVEILQLSDFADNFGGSIYDDYVSLGAGNDIADGHRGNDHIFGGDGDDLLSGGAGDDYLHGGAGNDTALYLFASGGVQVDLAGGFSTVLWGDAGNDTLVDIENARGSAFGDVLIGSNSFNALDGGGGDDVLFGQGGADILTGGAGADRFLYVTQYDSMVSAPDRISDFTSGIDKIDLRQAQAGRSVAWTALASGADTILSIDFGKDGTIDMQILLSGNKTVLAGDLLIGLSASSAEAPLASDSASHTTTFEATHVELLGSGMSGHSDLLV